MRSNLLPKERTSNEQSGAKSLANPTEQKSTGLKPHSNAQNGRDAYADRAPANGAAASPDSGPNGLGRRLDSWKEIAGYLKRHVTTVRRWEKQEVLPTHRHIHSKLGSVYAYTGELDRWMESRQPEGSSTAPIMLPTAGSHVVSALPPPPELMSPPCWPVNLIGRVREMELLREARVITCGGQLQLVCITGEPGQGKTRLALDFAREVQTDASILIGRCDREAIIPFAPFVSMLQRLRRAITPADLQRRLDGITGSNELAELVPGISQQTQSVRQPFHTNLEGRRFRMFEAYTELLRATSKDCPMLLVVEDFHWADRGSVLLLRHLMRSARDAPICVVVTYSESELRPCGWLQGILSELQRDSGARRISLGSLSKDETQLFIESWIGQHAPPALTELLFRQTEGNLLFLVELFTDLEATGRLAQLKGSQPAFGVARLDVPQGIRELIGRRLARLSPTSNKLLTFGAVVGRTFRFSLIEDLAGLDENAVLDGLEEAVAARIIVEESEAPGCFSFAHIMVRETLYNGMTAARRIRLHRRVGELLERGTEADRWALGELAYHFGNAAAEKDADKAVDYGIRAGDRALAGLAFEEAARYYGISLHALDVGLPSGNLADKRFEILRLRGRCFCQAGQWESAKAEFEKALALIDGLEHVNRCELLINLAETSFWLLDVQAVRRFASDARLLADEIKREDLWADAGAWIASAEVADGNLLGGVDMDRQTLARVGVIRSFALARIPLTLYWAGRTIEAAEHGAQAVEQARGSDDAGFLMYALQHYGLTLSGAGQYEKSLNIFEEARAFGRSCGMLPLLARATSMSVAPLLSIGDYSGARDRAMEAREVAYRVDFTPAIVSAGIDLLVVSARSHGAESSQSLISEVEKGVSKPRDGTHGSGGCALRRYMQS